MFNLTTQTDFPDVNLFDTLPFNTDLSDFLPNEEHVNNELEVHRLMQIYEQLPDHCIQLCFLS